MKNQVIILAAGISFAPALLKVLPFGKDLGWASSLLAQNIGINTDGTPAETGVMLDIKIPTTKATTAAEQTFFQIKSFDANTDALKLRLGFKTDATQTNRYGFIDFPDFTTSVPTYLPLCLQPSGGNVGIGTSAPNSKFKTHIYSGTSGTSITTPGNFQLLLENNSDVRTYMVTPDANSSYLIFGTPSSQIGGYLNWNYTNNTFDVATYLGSGMIRFLTGIGPSEKMRITSTGKVGISTITTTLKLNVDEVVGYPIAIGSGTQTNGCAQFSAVNADVYLDFGGGNAPVASWMQAHNGANTSSAPILLNPNGGNVGIGTTAPSTPLHVSSAGSSTILIENTTAVGGATFQMKESGTGNWTFKCVQANGGFKIRDVTAASDRITITNTGLVGIGRVPTTNILEINGAGSQTTAGSWLANSDRRIKTDIRDIDNALGIIMKLHPVKFKYTEEWKRRNPFIADHDHYYYNYIAQEYKEVFPESVQGSGQFLESDTTHSNEILQMDSYNAQIVSIKAIQEQQKIIEDQKKEIESMKKEFISIKSMLAALQLQINPNGINSSAKK